MLRVKRVKNSIFNVIFVIVVVLLVNGLIAVNYSESTTPLLKSAIESNIGGRRQSNEFVVKEESKLVFTKPNRQIKRNENENRNTPGVTLVSAYYDIGRNKYNGLNSYIRWAENSLRFRSPLVFFTNRKEIFKPIRDSYNLTNMTVYVELPFQDLDTVKTYLPLIKKKFPLDVERQINSAYLYALWYSKAELVRRAIELNPFHTKKYLWIDIGCIRSPLQSDEFPSKDRIEFLGYKNTVTMSSVGGYGEYCQNINMVHGKARTKVPPKLELPIITDVTQLNEYVAHYSMAGALFGGDFEVLSRFCELYFKEIGHYLTAPKDRYFMADQFLFYAMACVYNDIVEMIKPDNGNAWFYLVDYLRS